VKRISARALFGAALALFLAWVFGLGALAILSSTRPGEMPRRPAQAAPAPALDGGAPTE
jgi:hypothetical protein